MSTCHSRQPTGGIWHCLSPFPSGQRGVPRPAGIPLGPWQTDFSQAVGQLWGRSTLVPSHPGGSHWPCLNSAQLSVLQGPSCPYAFPPSRLRPGSLISVSLQSQHPHPLSPLPYLGPRTIQGAHPHDNRADGPAIVALPPTMAQSVFEIKSAVITSRARGRGGCRAPPTPPAQARGPGGRPPHGGVR